MKETGSEMSLQNERRHKMGVLSILCMEQKRMNRIKQENMGGKYER
jgi:hypothetical protein